MKTGSGKGRRHPLLDGKRVHTASDELGDILVIDYFNHRIMTFDSIYEQSRMDRNQPFVPVHEYTKAMLLGLLFLQGESVLLLGLGAGGLLRAIHRLYPRLPIEAVEIRPQVLAVAEQFFGVPKALHVHVTLEDAASYLNNQTAQSTGMIFADMYQAYDMDPLQKQVHFLQQSQRVLDEQGWLVMNFHEMPSIHSSFMLALGKLFAEILVCAVPGGNYIVYAGKQKLLAPLGDYFAGLADMQTRLHTSFDGVHQRLSRLQDAAWLKRSSGKVSMEDKTHFTDADFPPLPPE